MDHNSAHIGRSEASNRGEVAAWFAVMPVVAWGIAFVFESGFFAGKNIPVQLMDLTLIQTLKSAAVAYVVICTAILLAAHIARRYRKGAPLWLVALEGGIPTYGAALGGAKTAGLSFLVALGSSIPYGIAGAVVAVVGYRLFNAAHRQKRSEPDNSLPRYKKTLGLLERVSWLSIAIIVAVFFYGKNIAETGEVAVLDGCGPLSEIVSRNAESFYVLAPDLTAQGGVAYGVMTIDDASKHKIRIASRAEFNYRQREFYGPCLDGGVANNSAPPTIPKVDAQVFGLRSGYASQP